MRRFRLSQKHGRKGGVWTTAPRISSRPWLRDVIEIVSFLLDTLHDVPAFRGYCDYWWLLAHEIERDNVEWSTWLKLTDPATAFPPGLHELHFAHRLLTHFHVISNPLKNMTPAAERNDVSLCLMRRVWPARIQLKAFRDRIHKLCHETVSRVECTRILRRIKLAALLGFIPGVAASPPLDTIRRRTLLLEWRTPRDGYEWDADIAEGDATASAQFILDALIGYVKTYIRSSVTLNHFISTCFPKWPHGSPLSNQPCYIPCQSITLIRATMLMQKALRRYISHITPSTPEQEEIEMHAEFVFSAMKEVPGATQITALQVLAEWHNQPSDLIVQLVSLLELFQSGTNTKSRLKKLLCKWQTQHLSTLQWLSAIVKVWSQATLVRVIPAPYQWTMNVAEGYALQERINQITIAPMSDVFLYCPVCLRVCSIVTPPIVPTRRRRKKKRKRRKVTTTAVATESAEPASVSSGAGFEHVVVDVDHSGGRLMCASRKTGLTKDLCDRTQLKQLHMLGNIMMFHERVYLLCPQPRCGRLMQLEPGVCKYTEHGPCCFSCTQGEPPPISEPPPPLVVEAAPRLTLDEIFATAVATAPKQPLNEKLFDSDDDDDDDIVLTSRSV
jgi:hypothetical protein